MAPVPRISLSIALVLSIVTSTTSVGSEPPTPANTKHLIYLHGRIIQAHQDPRPKHPDFGFYELEKILDTFRERGFVVSGEIRAKEASVSESADHVVDQVRELLESGVPARHITVLGGSMGAGIALVASARLQNPEIRFAVLGTCLSKTIDRLVKREGVSPIGYILAIREASDDYTASCPGWEAAADSASSLHVREIVLDTGLRHGFLYTPLAEWVEPVLEWADTSTGGEQHGEGQ